jgi:hypothetical protein
MSLTDQLNDLHTNLDQYRDAIYDSGSELSKHLGINIGQCAEIGLYGQSRSIILGGYGYMGFIDDHSKHLVALPNGSTVCKHGFNSVYMPLQDSGYEVERPKSTRFLGSGDDSEVLNFLATSGVTRFAQAILEGTYTPEYIVFTKLDGDADYERSKMMGAAAFVGGDLGEALALSALVKSGKMDILQVPPSYRTSMETRSLQDVEWPKMDLPKHEKSGAAPKV